MSGSSSSLKSIRWPRSIRDHQAFAEIERILEQQLTDVCPEVGLLIPKVDFTPTLEKVIQFGVLHKKVIRGFESIEKSLENEQKGLASRQAKEKEIMEMRVSRLLLLSDDCTPRLYRAINSVLRKYDPRVFCIGMNCDSGVLGQTAFGKPGPSKVLMLNHKKEVAEFLAGLIAKPA